MDTIEFMFLWTLCLNLIILLPRVFCILRQLIAEKIVFILMSFSHFLVLRFCYSVYKMEQNLTQTNEQKTNINQTPKLDQTL